MVGNLFPQLALPILVASGLWLIGVGWLMAARPQRALDILSLTASSHRINLIEQGLRLAAGAALITRAPVAKLPDLFAIGGWFVVVTSLLLMVVPLRWHAGYAIWWARRLPTWVVRTIAPLSMLAGAGLIFAVT